MTHSTTSKELSERLKALGVPQTSYFAWVGDELWDATMQSDYETPGTIARDKWAAAFTAGELGEMLPLMTKSWKYEFEGYNSEFGQAWVCEALEHEHEQSYVSEAESRGLMLEYLLTNGLLQADAMV